MWAFLSFSESLLFTLRIWIFPSTAERPVVRQIISASAVTMTVLAPWLATKTVSSAMASAERYRQASHQAQEAQEKIESAWLWQSLIANLTGTTTDEAQTLQTTTELLRRCLPLTLQWG